jgi:hypothetical protein
MILGSKSHGIHPHILLSDGSESLQTTMSLDSYFSLYKFGTGRTENTVFNSSYNDMLRPLRRNTCLLDCYLAADDFVWLRYSGLSAPCYNIKG